MKFYKILSLLTAALFAYLFIELLLNTDSFVTGIGMQSCLASDVLGRRASVLMLGFAVLLFLSRNISPSKERQYISLAIAVTMMGFASMGSYELIMKRVNSGIIQAICIETAVTVSFIISFIKDRKAVKKNN